MWLVIRKEKETEMKSFNTFITENITIRDVNKVAKKYNVKLNKGKGYFYFTGTNDETKMLLAKAYTTSVYVYSVYELSLSQWEDEIKNILKQR
jgi:phage terminase large subunit